VCLYLSTVWYRMSLISFQDFVFTIDGQDSSPLTMQMSLEPHAQSLPNFVCVLPVSVARSSSDMFRIGHIAYRREGVFFPIVIVVVLLQPCGHATELLLDKT